MKIYPNKNSVVATKTINPDTDIPLSFIDTSSSEYKTTILTEEEFRIEELKEILPYSSVSENMCLFYKDGMPVPYDEMLKNFVRDNDRYLYIPHGSTVFSPKTFEYTVTGKKTMEIKSNRLYDIRVSILNNRELAKKMMPIFGDSQKRGVAPANVSVNKGDLSIDLLTSIRLSETDITIVNMTDTETLLEEDYFDPNSMSRVPFDPTLYFSNSTVSIVGFLNDESLIDEDSVDSNNKDTVFVNLKEETEFVFKKNQVYSDLLIKTKKVFTIPTEVEEGIVYHSMFPNSEHTPILIKEYVGQGIVIFCSEDIIKSPLQNYKVIYELLTNIFSQSYLRTNKIKDWIADRMTDYIVENKKLVKKEYFTSYIELHKMFQLEEEDIYAYSVDIEKKLYPFVDFVGTDKNFLRFKKNIDGDNSQYADPVQKEGTISIYTENKNIIYFNNFLYSIKNDIEKRININITDREVEITAKSYKNSDLGIYIKDQKTTLTIALTRYENENEISLNSDTYFIVARQNLSASYYEVVKESEYEEKNGIILTKVKIAKHNTSKLVYDMRQRGGGLPENTDVDYDCFDVSHVLGKPYRKGGSLIITLPKRLKVHDSLITSAINKYINATDLPIIIYE